MDRVKEFILEHIQSEYDLPEGVDIDSFNFVENGYIDSVGMVSFVMEMEDEFGISFEDSELTDPKFQIIGSLAELITKKIEES